MAADWSRAKKHQVRIDGALIPKVVNHTLEPQDSHAISLAAQNLTL